MMNIKHRLILTAGACSILLSTGSLGAQADDAAPAQQPATAAAETPASPPLQGGVKGQTVTVRTATQDLGEIDHHIKQALNCLIYEMQRQDVVSVAPGDIIGGNIVLPTLPDPSGVVALGDFLPPRKKWVDFYMSHMQILVPEAEKEVFAMIIPNDPSGNLNGMIIDYKERMNDIVKRYMQLQQDTVGPTYKSSPIIDESIALYKKVEEFDKQRKEIWKTVKELEKKP